MDTGKENCHVIDFVDAGDRGQGVASVSSLFGVDPSEEIEGISVSSKNKMPQKFIRFVFQICLGKIYGSDELLPDRAFVARTRLQILK